MQKVDDHPEGMARVSEKAARPIHIHNFLRATKGITQQARGKLQVVMPVCRLDKGIKHRQQKVVSVYV